MIVRALLVVAARTVAGYALARHADAGACSQALSDSYRVDGKAVAERLREHCRGGDDLASAAAVLARGPRAAEAQALARQATRREPDNARAWLGLAFALRASDPAGARRAQARATALNPYAATVAP